MSQTYDLESGLEELGFGDSTDLAKRMMAFVEDLKKWNKVYNLTAIRKTEDIVVQHLLDSLSISPYLEAQSVIDVGTGGGFPGIPLAMVHEQTRFALLDSNVKKTRFLQQMVINHQLQNCEVLHTRAESFIGTFDAVVCRAFASLPDIVGYAGHLVAPGGKLLAMKGQLGDEVDLLDESNTELKVENIVTLSVPGLEAQRHLVVLGRQK